MVEVPVEFLKIFRLPASSGVWHCSCDLDRVPFVQR